MKKIILLVLSLILFVSLACFVGCNSSSDETLAENIKISETNITGYRGQMCNLPVASAKVQDNDVTVLVRVKDGKDNEVPVVNNAFYVGNEEYTAEYYIVVDKTTHIKRVKVNVNDVNYDSTIIKGKLEYWVEPGTFDISKVDVVVNDYYGQRVSNDKLVAKVVKNLDGEEQTVEITDSKIELSLGKYTLRYVVEGKETVNSVVIFVSEKKFDSNNKLIFADFVEENCRSSFATDYQVEYDVFNEEVGLVKNWEIRRKSWEIIFISDGFADFKNGGTVSFKTAVLWQNVDCKINYYPADGSQVQVLGDFGDLAWYEEKELSFNIPAGGTLVGARLEFVLPNSELFGHSFYDVKVDLNTFSFKNDRTYVKKASSCDISNYDLSILDIDNNIVTNNIEYFVDELIIDKATGAESKSPVQVVDGKFDMENGKLYLISASVDGIKAKGSIKIYNKGDLAINEDGMYEYMTMSEANPIEQFMFTADYEGVTISVLNDSPNALYGLQKEWNNYRSTWSYTFNSNGNLDYSNGATVYFDSCMTAWVAVPNKVTLTRVDGTTEVLFDSTSGNYVVDTLHFTLGANEELAGCTITFETPDQKTIGHCFGNVLIELPKPIEHVSLTQNAQGQYEYMVLSESDTEDLSRVSIMPKNHPTLFVPMADNGVYGLFHDCNADWDVPSWNYRFNKECSNVDFSNGATVYFDCCLFNDVATSVKLIRANGQEESLGELLTWQTNPQKLSFKLAPNESLYDITIAFNSDNGWSYVSFNNVLIELPKPIEYVSLTQNAQGQYEYMVLSESDTEDLSRVSIMPKNHPTLFVPMADNGVYGLFHDCNADWDVPSWNYRFNKECSNVDFSNGATVYFDCCLFNDVATSVKLIRANGQEESLGDLLMWQTTPQKLSFKLAPNESLYDITIAFNGGGWSYVSFNNVLIDITNSMN